MKYKSGISVVVPVYNAEKTLSKCIESVINQEYKNWKLILVDDGSKDSSSQICDSYAKQYDNISVIHIENGGVSNARNIGMEAVETEFLVFVDSDDWVDENYLQCLDDAKEKYPDAGHWWCCLKSVGSLVLADQPYLASNEEYTIFDKSQIMTLSKLCIANGPFCKLNRTAIIRDNDLKMDIDCSLGEDLMFNFDYIDASNNGKIIVVNKATYNYYMGNENSLFQKYRSDLFDNIKKSKNYQKRFLDKWDVSKTDLEQYWNTYFSALLGVFDNTMSDQNHMSYEDKISYNTSILNSATFIEVFKNSTDYINPLLKKALQSKNYKNVIWFERLVKIKNEGIKGITDRVKSRILRKKNKKLAKKFRSKIDAKDFTIISQNCIGGVIYHDLEMKFDTPTVNLFVCQPDFEKFIMNLEHYLDSELVIVSNKEFPVGRLDDIFIWFMHYTSPQEAIYAWNKRKARVNYDKILVLSTDRNGFDNESFEMWKQIKYPKILFTCNEKYASDKDSLYLKKYKNEQYVPDLIPHRDFYKGNMLVNKINSLGK